MDGDGEGVGWIADLGGGFLVALGHVSEREEDLYGQEGPAE